MAKLKEHETTGFTLSMKKLLWDLPVFDLRLKRRNR